MFQSITKNHIVGDYYNASWGAICKKYSSDSVSLDDVELTFFSILYLDGDVTNGGFCQAIENPTGEIFPVAHRSLERIGAVRAAAVLGTVLALMPKDTNWDLQESRQDKYGLLSETEFEALEALDDRWFSLQDEIGDLLGKFLEEAGHRT